jgi:hypothetical protein
MKVALRFHGNFSSRSPKNKLYGGFKVADAVVHAPPSEFEARILELCNHAFSRMYAEVFKKYWHNSVYARMARNYCATDWKNRVYEVYIPTQENVEFNMQYYHVVVRVLPELDSESYMEALEQPVRLQTPPGIIDSELICIIAPKRSERAKKEKQFIRGRRVRPGWLTTAIINPIPEICMKRLLTLIANFLHKRLLKFFDSVQLGEALEDWLQASINIENVSLLYYKESILSIIEHISLSLKNMVACLSHSLNWILKQIKMVLTEIGKQNMARLAVRKAKELRDLLNTLKGYREKPPIVKKLLDVLPFLEAG